MKVLIGLDGVHAFYVSIFGGIEASRAEIRSNAEMDIGHQHVRVAPS